ncbi:hypothetical protein SALBM217S_09332 [Streptomyces griseoloalbus]
MSGSPPPSRYWELGNAPQILAEYGGLLPFAVEPLLQPLRQIPLLLRLLASGLVLLGGLRRLLVEPRHFGADGGGAVTGGMGSVAVGGPGGEHGECAEQHGDEQRTAAGETHACDPVPARGREARSRRTHGGGHAPGRMLHRSP